MATTDKEKVDNIPGQELNNSTDGMQIRTKNRIKAATNNVARMLKAAFRPAKKYIIIAGIGVALAFIVVVLLTAALWYIKDMFTKQDTDSPKNVPGTTKNVMTATAVTDPNTGEITFLYNEKKPSTNQSTNLGSSSANSTIVTSLDNFLFIGDSRYAGTDSYIKNLGNNIKNAGVGSSNIDEWVAVVTNKGKGTVHGKAVDITGTYSGISIQLGVNSLYQNVDNTVNSMKTLITETQKLYPNVPIFVNSCVQVNSKLNGYDITTFRDNINDFNNAVQDYCNTIDNVYYIDVNTNLNDSNGFLKNECTEDGLHCNARGGLQFADNIKNAILNSKPTGNTKTITVESIMSEMTLEEKINQMMMVQSAVSDGNQLSDIKYGGYIVGSNSNYNNNLQKIGSNYKIKPFVATDDEGGLVTRAASQYKTNARTYGDNKDYTKLSTDETEKSNYLLGLGINLNLGPVTDAISNTSGALYSRSFSGDPAVVKECIKTIIEARKKSNLNGVSISSSLKHYPGYPDTSVNTDFGVAQSDRSIDDINKNIDVFKEGANLGAQSIMVSNVIYTNYDANNPASLSPTIIGDLRKNFNGVIMTDDIGNAQGVGNRPNRFKEAIMAGNDMILIGNGNTTEAYNQINDAVSNGEISEDQINKSVERILKWKSDVGLLQLGTVADNTSNNNEGDSNFLIMTKSIVISQNDKGEYCIATDLEARVNEIYKVLKENESSALIYFEDEEEAKEALRLWIIAEYSSQYVNLSKDVENYKYDYNSDYIQGSIKVKRYFVDDNGKEVERYITYKTPEEFNQLKSNYQNSGDTTVFDYFTVDSEDNLVVAKYVREDQTSSWTGETDPNGDLDPIYTKYNISEQKLNYRNMAREYSMPFNLLWAMVVYGEDVSFSNEIAKLIIDSEMVIGIRDNVTTTVTTTVDKYLNEEKLREYVRLTVSSLNLPSSIQLGDARYFYEYYIRPSGTKTTSEGVGNDYSVNADNTGLNGINESLFFEKTTVNTLISNYVDMEMEYIDSWFAKYEMKYEPVHTPGADNSNTVPVKNTEYELIGVDTKETNDPDEADRIINGDKYAPEMYNNLRERIKASAGKDILRNAMYGEIQSYLSSQGAPYYQIVWNNGQIVDDIINGIGNSYSYLTQGSVDAIVSGFKVDEVRERCVSIHNSLLATYNEAKKEEILNENIRAIYAKIEKENYRRTVNRTITTIVNVDTKKFNKIETKVTEKTAKKTENGETESFVSILCKKEHAKAYAGFTGSLSKWFFSSIAKNEDTEVYIDLIKYLLYKATGEDYGVTEYDMSTVKFKLNQSGMKNTGTVRGGTIQAKVWFALKELGYDDEHVAAVMGNIHWESGGFSSMTVESNGVGIGLIQWSFGRRTSLEAYAASKGLDWKDEDTQVEFLIAEMTQGGGANGYANYQFCSYNGYTPNDWYNATTIEDATIAFCWTFERPGIPHISDRIKWAKYYYDEFHGKTLASFDNSDFLQLAIEIHDYIRINNFYYGNGSAIPIPAGQQYIDCSAYVSWVLYDYGYQELFQNNGNWQYIVSTFRDKQSYLESTYGWVYKDPSQAQPGDLLIYDNWGHIEIYAGGDDQYGAGSTDAIRRVNPNKGNYKNQAIKAITITKPK